METAPKYQRKTALRNRVAGIHTRGENRLPTKRALRFPGGSEYTVDDATNREKGWVGWVLYFCINILY